MPHLTVPALFDEETAAGRKTCSRCSLSRPLEDFGLDHRVTWRRVAACKPCTAIIKVESAARRKAGVWKHQVVPIPAGKACSKCGETKPLEEFPRQQKGLYGRASRCKECRNAYRATQRREIPQTVLAKERTYRAANAERIRSYGAGWKREERARNPEVVRARQNAWRARTADARRAWWNAWREANPERWREITRQAQHRRRARKRNSLALHFSNEQLLAKMAYWGNRCYACGAPWSQADHVKPISRGGGHLLANLRPMCRSCNASKGSKWCGPWWAMGLIGNFSHQRST